MLVHLGETIKKINAVIKCFLSAQYYFSIANYFPPKNLAIIRGGGTLPYFHFTVCQDCR